MDQVEVEIGAATGGPIMEEATAAATGAAAMDVAAAEVDSFAFEEEEDAPSLGSGGSFDSLAEAGGADSGGGMELGDKLLVGALVVLSLLVLVIFFVSRMGRGATTAAGIATTAVKQSGKKGVVLVGCSGAGKTVIFHRLVSPLGTPPPETLPSMVAAYGQLAVAPSGGGGGAGAAVAEVAGSKKLSVVDFPGHERLWATLLQQVVGAKGVVLVVDPTANAAIKKAALLLFELLSSPVALGPSTPLLIFCNKADDRGAKDSARVVKMLQNEVESLRKSSRTMEAAALEGMSSAEVKRPVGLKGKPFRLLDGVEEGELPCPVSVATGSALATGGLENLLVFLHEKC
jgi:GTPase SAR1 family protein